MTTHFANPYNEYLLAESKSKAEANATITIKRMLADKGFRGHEMNNGEILVISFIKNNF